MLEAPGILGSMASTAGEKERRRGEESREREREREREGEEGRKERKAGFLC
jgi:hypothetical protein